MIQSSILAIVKTRIKHNLTRQNPFRPNPYDHELLWTNWDMKCLPPRIDRALKLSFQGFQFKWKFQT
jgi:hypothetical protein